MRAVLIVAVMVAAANAEPAPAGSAAPPAAEPPAAPGHAIRLPYIEPPTVTLSRPVTKGAGLSTQVVHRSMKRLMPRIRFCYETRLQTVPKLAGVLKASFRVAADGHVTSPSVTGFDSEVATCVAKVIEQSEFPKPTDGKVVSVSCKVTFAPTGSAAPATKPRARP